LYKLKTALTFFYYSYSCGLTTNDGINFVDTSSLLPMLAIEDSSALGKSVCWKLPAIG